MGLRVRQKKTDAIAVDVVSLPAEMRMLASLKISGRVSLEPVSGSRRVEDVVEDVFSVAAFGFAFVGDGGHGFARNSLSERDESLAHGDEAGEQPGVDAEPISRAVLEDVGPGECEDLPTCMDADCGNHEPVFGGG